MMRSSHVCLRFIDEPCLSLAAYEQQGGYQVWRKIIAQKADRHEIVRILEDAGLRGRGGVWLPPVVKARFMDTFACAPSYLVVNSDEGEPGTCKDGLILKTNPHQVIEGCLIAAYILGVQVIYHYLRGEFVRQFDGLEHAREEVYHAGLAGSDVLKSGVDIQMHHVLGAGSYIVGEETAMLESIEGKRPLPRRKPPFPAECGLYGRPTVMSNTETLASIPIILDKGSDWYKSQGVNGSVGVKIFSVSAHVNHPGVFELPLGTSFSDLLEKAGGVHKGRALKAVIPGGTSMKVLPASLIMQANMEPDSIMGLGSLLGTGGVIVLDERTCMVKALEIMMTFYHHESCGQCSPCREGSGWILAMIRRILRGDGKRSDVDDLVAIAKGIEGRTMCAFGEAMAWPVTSFVAHFREEFDYFVTHGNSLMVAQYGSDGFSWG